MSSRPLSTSATAVLADWPVGEWLTEAELATLLPDTYGIKVGADGYRLGDGRTLRGVLSEARRAGLLLRNQRYQPPIYRPTEKQREVSS